MSSEITTTPPTPKTMLEERPLFVSPTIKLLPKTERPPQSTLCEICPASVWFQSRGVLECYCRVLKLKTWTKMKPHVFTACDGYVMAIEDMIAKQAEAGR